MTYEECQRWLQWRYRHMRPLERWAFFFRLLFAHLRGRSGEFMLRDARSIDKPNTMNDNEAQEVWR